jgi:hypothetical protein
VRKHYEITDNPTLFVDAEKFVYVLGAAQYEAEIEKAFPIVCCILCVCNGFSLLTTVVNFQTQPVG